MPSARNYCSRASARRTRATLFGYLHPEDTGIAGEVGAAIAAFMAGPTAPLTQVLSSQIGVSLRKAGGTFVVPVEINGAISLDFMVDSGAADVKVPRSNLRG